MAASGLRTGTTYSLGSNASDMPPYTTERPGALPAEDGEIGAARARRNAPQRTRHPSRKKAAAAASPKRWCR